jgi:Carboxypeptidase regulatory-like domain
VRPFLALLSLSAVAIARRPEPQPTGSARITGRVLAMDNGAPVRRALVRLEATLAGTQSAGPTHVHFQKDVETDDNGAFDFAGLPGGSYYISVTPTNRFLDLPSARRAIVGEGRALEVTIRLERTGAIMGRIADRNGEGPASRYRATCTSTSRSADRPRSSTTRTRCTPALTGRHGSAPSLTARTPISALPSNQKTR